MRKVIISLFLSLVSLVSICSCNVIRGYEEIKAEVVGIDKFGHLELNVKGASLSSKGYALGDMVCVKVGEHEVEMPYYDGYYTNPGEVLLYLSSEEDRVYVCINYDNFSEEYNVSVGDTVYIEMVEKEKMLMTQEICSLKYTNNREDFESDEVFANFRVVKVGRIAEGKLYRNASPISNRFGRASIADDLIEEVGVKTVLNLSDTTSDIDGWIQKEDFDSPYYLSLYQSNNVLGLDLIADFRSDEFIRPVIEGLTFLAHKDAPYDIHCEEGKDRAGFVCMLLEALMGATLDEILSDYMISFYNYYGVTKDDEPVRYQAILDFNILPMMYHVMGVDSLSELEEVNLEEAVTNYLLDNGMKQEDIDLLKEKLS